MKWDSVPGASAYLVDVAPNNAGVCAWGTGWRVSTAIPSWSPLGSGWNNIKPYPDAMPVSYDGTALVLNQHYCVRVRARGERDTGNQDVYGDFTYLDDGTGSAFQWVGLSDRRRVHADLQSPATSAPTTTCFRPAARSRA